MQHDPIRKMVETKVMNKSKEDCLVSAIHWLDNALKYEAEGKSTAFIDKALNMACHYENCAFDGR